MAEPSIISSFLGRLKTVYLDATSDPFASIRMMPVLTKRRATVTAAPSHLP